MIMRDLTETACTLVIKAIGRATVGATIMDRGMLFGMPEIEH
jgi:hypothetical protein